MARREYEAETLRRLIAIDHKTDSMEDSLSWLVRANAPGLKDELLAAFGTSLRNAQVYVALNGKRNVAALADHLGMKRPNVSRALAWLAKKRLVDVADGAGNSVIYTKKFFDAVVGLSDSLMLKFQLDEDGRKKKAGRK